jgi:electron transfer flavoprotein beta subunit
MQTHYRLAAAFEMSIAADVVAFGTENGRVTVECELGGGDRAVVELTLPCVIAATKGLNQPRYPKLPDILKAKKKEVKQIDMAELQMPPEAACAELLELIPVPDRGRAQMLQGSTREMVEELVHRLKDEEKVL